MKNWVTKKLGDVCELSAGGDVPKGNFSEIKTDNHQIPIYANGEKNEGFYGYTSKAKVTKPSITVSGRGTIGYSVKRIEPFFPIVRLIVVTPINLEELGLNYLDYAIRKIDFKHSGSSIPQLTVPMIRDYEIPLPPLPEQQRIVATLDEAFAAIAKAKANAEQNLKNAKELFESYLQELFENKGEGWEEKRLEEICFKITDGSHNPPKGIDYSEYLMISSKNVNNDFIDLDSPRYLKKEDFISENKRTEVIEGDVLLTIVGTIGRVAVVTNEHKYFTLQRSVAVLKPKKDFISSRFLMFSLRNIFEELNENARGVAQKGLYLNQIRSLEISIPKLKTQQIIVEKIDFLLAETKKLESIYQQKINYLEELKKSVLQKAFSGELKTEKELV